MSGLIRFYFLAIFLLVSSGYCEESWSLEALVSRALDCNPETHQAWYAAREAAALHCQSLSDNYPAISYSQDWNYTHNSLEGSGNSSTSTTMRQGLSLTYLLFDSGERYWTHQLTYATAWAAQRDYDFTMQSVMLEVIRRYTLYMNALEVLKIRQADVEDAQVSLEAARELYKAGVKSRSDLLQAETSFLNRKVALEGAIGGVEITLSALKESVYWPQESDIEVRGLPEGFSPQKMDEAVEQYLEWAREYRQDIAAACIRYQGSLADVERSRSAGWPRVTTNWDVSRTENLKPRQTYLASGTIGVSFPLYQGGFFKNGIRRAVATSKRQFATLENVRQEASLQVVQNYWALKTAFNQYQYSIKFLKNAEESYEVTLERYRSGIGSIQALFDAQNQLTAARSEHVRAQTDWIVAFADLSFASGMLTSPDLVKGF